LLERVISGGNNGAFLAGLVAAERCGIPTGGTAAKHFQTETGPQYILKTRFGLEQSKGASYPLRTKLNVQNSDLSLILNPIPDSPDCILTFRFCEELKKPCLIFNPYTTDHKMPIAFILEHRPSVVNCAGNRESVSPGLTRFAAEYLKTVFSAVLAEPKSR
jgi:hypothetical protein